MKNRPAKVRERFHFGEKQGAKQDRTKSGKDDRDFNLPSKTGKSSRISLEKGRDWGELGEFFSFWRGGCGDFFFGSFFLLGDLVFFL